MPNAIAIAPVPFDLYTGTGQGIRTVRPAFATDLQITQSYLNIVVSVILLE